MLASYRGSGNVLSSIPPPVQLDGYISTSDKLPDPLPKLKADLEVLIKDYQSVVPGKLVAKVSDPEADDGKLAKQLEDAGFQPLTAGLLNQKRFWFHLVVRSGDKAEQVPLPASLDKDGVKRNLEATLKRFMPGALRTVALYTPPSPPAMPQFGMDASGRVPEQADVLFVVAPDNLDRTQLLAIA